MSSLPLFDRYSLEDLCSRKHRGSPESEAAHAVVVPRKAELHALILGELAWLAEVGAGGTCEELSQALQMRYTTCSARCSELLKAGRIRKSGARRPTSTGCLAAVLVIA